MLLEIDRKNKPLEKWIKYMIKHPRENTGKVLTYIEDVQPTYKGLQIKIFLR